MRQIKKCGHAIHFAWTMKNYEIVCFISRRLLIYSYAYTDTRKYIFIHIHDTHIYIQRYIWYAFCHHLNTCSKLDTSHEIFSHLWPDYQHNIKLHADQFAELTGSTWHLDGLLASKNAERRHRNTNCSLHLSQKSTIQDYVQNLYRDYT